ncbi:hypothetical protein DVH05_012778 [Phytophthora capsici]|nr:hypothetical protein DVH05_012778 [Phytophthora capsici]
MEESIVENIAKGGAVVGGNPSAILQVLLMGGGSVRKHSDVNLSALVKVLSKRQREILLEQLKQSL